MIFGYNRSIKSRKRRKTMEFDIYEDFLDQYDDSFEEVSELDVSDLEDDSEKTEN